MLSLSVFFAPVRCRLVKITYSCFEVILRTMKNYKAHYSLSWFGPLLRENSPTSSVFCIEEEEQCYTEVSSKLEEFAKLKGEMSRVPLPEG
jgi:hypothetical protein